MLSSKDIRNVKFSKSVGGYKQEEVEILLDKIEADYDQFERTVSDLNSKIEKLNGEVESYKNSQESIQSVLISAQRLADQIVDEAKAKSDEIVRNAESSIEMITAKEKELTLAFDRKASERKAQAEKELEDTVKAATEKSNSIERATEDSVRRQQLLFDKLKLEISAFKAEITRTYKEHLEVLQKLPDQVPMDPTQIAKLVSDEYNKVPNVEDFIEEKAEEIIETKEQETAEENAEDIQVEEDVGFIINVEDLSGDK